jgi:hypothetical protein
MKNLAVALTAIAALTMGVLTTADAQGKGRRDGAHRQGHPSMQHRAGPRKFAHTVDRRHVRPNAHHGWKRGYHRPGKRVWRMKHRRHARRHWHRKHKRFHRRFHHRHHRRFHGPHRYRPHAYTVVPAYDTSAGPSHGLEVETPDFRFKVYGSS